MMEDNEDILRRRPSKPAGYRESLLVIDCVMFAKDETKFFFDVNIQQASNLLWKKCPTMYIINAWQYQLGDAVELKQIKRKLTDDELAKLNKNF